jgi:hypothetical protein
VPLRQRLNCCALVCRTWAAAAAAAPAEVVIWLDSRDRCAQLQGWLAKCGDVVVSVSTRDDVASRRGGFLGLKLPTPELTALRQLSVSRLNIRSNCRSSSVAAGSAAVTLPRLQELRLSGCELTVRYLSQLLSATNLTRLHLARLNFTECATAVDVASLSKMQQQHVTQLLAALQHLTQLRHLELSDMALYRVSAQPHQGGSYQCFSALTASTQLTVLILAEDSNMPVPQAAFEHMFPPGLALPHLKHLCLYGSPYRPCVDAPQIGSIAITCTALQQLTLWGVTPKGFDISCLAQLPLCVTEVKGLDWTRPVPSGQSQVTCCDQR